MIWGTRYGDPDPHVKQTNILGYIKKIAENPKASDILDLYYYLCDIAHPSFIGNARFWSRIDKINEDKTEQRVIERYSEGPHTDEILDKVLWTIGWSSAVLRNSFEMSSISIQKLLEKIK